MFSQEDQDGVKKCHEGIHHFMKVDDSTWWCYYCGCIAHEDTQEFRTKPRMAHIEAFKFYLNTIHPDQKCDEDDETT